MLKFHTYPVWLALLLAFFFPHAEPGEEGAEDTDGGDDAADDDGEETGDGDDSESDDSDTSADDGDADDSDDEPAPVRKAAKSKPDGQAAEAVRLAREAADAVRGLTEQANRRPDPVFAEEERKLASAETSDLEKWQIQSNRQLRQAQEQSNRALFQAQDMADKTDYAAKAIGNPIYSKFKDKVETQLAEARQKGANPPREMVLDLLIGREMRLGNFKSKSSAPAKKVSRGKPTGARSDTPVRGSQSERQKREARLSNRQI